MGLMRREGACVEWSTIEDRAWSAAGALAPSACILLRAGPGGSAEDELEDVGFCGFLPRARSRWLLSDVTQAPLPSELDVVAWPLVQGYGWRSDKAVQASVCPLGQPSTIHIHRNTGNPSWRENNMRKIALIIMAIAGIGLQPASSSQVGGECRCIPQLIVTPVSGCGCSLQISNVFKVEGVCPVMYFFIPMGGWVCARHQGVFVACRMQFKAKETGAGGCTAQFGNQAGGNGCGSFVQWSLPCSGGGAHQLVVACGDCPYVIPVGP